MSGSGISWAVCRQCFTGRMPFLPPNQQRQSTEGTYTSTCLLMHQSQGMLTENHDSMRVAQPGTSWTTPGVTSSIVSDLHLSHADPQVAFVELVRNVPPERSELASLLHETVEEAQAEQHLLPTLALHCSHTHTGMMILASSCRSQQPRG